MKNKIITIYELMGFIKDNKVPKKIKIDNREYDYNLGDYYSTKGVSLLNDYNLRLCSIEEILEAKIEILPEENDEWEDIEEIQVGDVYDITKVLNKLIKNQKYLKERLDKNE